MTVYNTTFFFPPQIETAVREWLRDMWIPAATAACCSKPLVLSMEQAQDDVARLAIQAAFPSQDAAQAFAAREATLLAEEMAAHFGAQTVVAYPTFMTEIEL